MPGPRGHIQPQERARRIDAVIPVEFREKGRMRIRQQGRLINVSMTGLYVGFLHPPHLNELVEGLPRGRMGTTCLSVWCGEDHLTVGHVGDTRAYLLRGNELRCLTVDHRPAGERLRRGEIDWTTYLDEVSQGSLTRCMGAGVERFEMDLVECAVRPGDRLLLCTDGLTDSISERDLSRLLPQGEPLAAARALEDRALASGGRDNITIVVADFH